MPAKIPWGKKQIGFVNRNYHKMTNPELADKLGMKLQTFRTKVIAMGLKRMDLQYWTSEQIVFLKQNYKKIGDKELAILFNQKWEKQKGWTWKHIEKKRIYLNLNRSVAQLKKIKKRNTDRGCWLGTTTWKTRGEAPVGEIRIWKNSSGRNKYKAIKTENGFVHYAPWLYERHFGKMPAGYCIGFKDRNNMNVVIENLEAITRAEHARRNRRYPDNIREAIKILNELNNLIKQKS